MRDFKNMKRQRGRNRSGGNSSSGGGGGGRPQQNANRAFESNGPDNIKIRGHAQHVFEKYQQLARDAFSSGDRVLAENYLQHADHYFRLLRTIQPNRPASEILGRDTVASGLDIDFEEEFEAQSEDGGGDAMEGGDGQQGFEPRQDTGRYDRDNRQDRYEGARNDGVRNDGSRNDGVRNDGARNDGVRSDNGWRDRQDGRPDNRQDNRQDRDRQDRDRQDNRVGFDRPDRGGERPYNDRQNAERPSPDRQDRNRPYNDRPQDGDRGTRFEGRRDNRRFDTPRDDRNGAREGREPRFDGRQDGFADGPQPSLAEAAEPMPVSVSAPIAAPEPAPAETSPVLRSHDGGVSEAPAFLQPLGGDAEEARPRVRRRRAPRTFQPGEDGAEPQSPAPTDQD